MYMYIDTQTQIFLLLLYPMSGSKGLGIAWVLKSTILFEDVWSGNIAVR